MKTVSHSYKLENVIPKNVEYIDGEAFLGCSGLKRIYLETPHIKDGGFLPDDIRECVEVIKKAAVM